MAMAIFPNSICAWASDVPAPGTGFSDMDTQDPWKLMLSGAQGSQLGLFYFRQRVFSNCLFMQLKFSPTSLTVYSQVRKAGDKATAGKDIIITVTTASGTSSTYAYSGARLRRDAVDATSISLASGDSVSVSYPTYDVLHSYVQNSPTFSSNPNTFNSGITHILINYENGKVVQSKSGVNQNSFVVRDGGIHETGYQDENLIFANGASIDFDPFDNTFSIQKGTGSPDTSIKVTSSTNGQVVSNLSLDQDSFNNPFSLGNRIEISTTSANPITSVKNTLTGDVTSGSDLTSQGWNLDGDNTVMNRYDSVQLYWQPTASQLPTYRYMLYKYLGSSNFETLKTAHPAFFDWLITDPEALNLFLTSGYASTSLIGGMGAYKWSDNLDPDSELSALNIWSRIWNKYPDSRGGENLKIAVAVALDFSHNVMAWQPGKPINPLGRYELYASAFANHILIGTFGDYSAQMLRDVVDDRISNAGMEWLRSYIIDHNSVYTFPSKLVYGYYLIDYLEYSPYGWVQKGGFYGPKSTIWNIMRYGGVCGAMSKASVFLLNAFGMPGYAEGEPAHCAFIFFYTNNKWELGYAYTGWEHTGGRDSNEPWTFNGTQLDANQYSKDKSYFLTFEAEQDIEQGNYQQALSKVQSAVALAPNNVDAWRVYIQVANYLNLDSGLASKIQSTFDSLASTNQPYTAWGPSLNYDVIISSLTSQIKS